MPVAHRVVVEGDAALVGPLGVRTVLLDPLGLGLDPGAVLFHPLDGHNVRLEVGEHPHEPVEELRDAERVRDHQPRLAGVDGVGKEEDEDGGAKGDQGPEGLQPHGQPPVQVQPGEVRRLQEGSSVHFENVHFLGSDSEFRSGF